MKKILAILTMCLLVTAFEAGAKKKGTPVMTFSERTYDFGTIPETKGTVSHEFEFENTGDAPLVIVDATAECGCTTPEFSPAPIMPGKKGYIKVTYNPYGRPGGFTKKVNVRSNAKPKKTFLLIKGVVNPNKK